MPKTTKTDETDQAGAARRDARGARATGTIDAPETRPSREPRMAGRATATPPATAAPAETEAPMPPVPSADALPDPGPSREQIAQRAYELYRERGGTDGQEIDDWVRAEQELREGRGRRRDET